MSEGRARGLRREAGSLLRPLSLSSPHPSPSGTVGGGGVSPTLRRTLWSHTQVGAQEPSGAPTLHATPSRPTGLSLRVLLYLAVMNVNVPCQRHGRRGGAGANERHPRERTAHPSRAQRLPGRRLSGSGLGATDRRPQCPESRSTVEGRRGTWKQTKLISTMFLPNTPERAHLRVCAIEELWSHLLYILLLLASGV